MSAVMFKRSALSILMATALAGCSLAPVYERPNAPVTAAWPDQPKVSYGGYTQATTVGTQTAEAVAPAGALAAAELGWKEFFLDVRLQTLIELALVNNRDMRVAMLRVDEARAQFGIQRGAQWPQLSGGVQGSRQRLPSDMRMGGAAAPSVTSQNQSGLALTSFELDLFGRLRNLSEAAYQNYLATEQAQKSAHISLISSVAQAYFNQRAAQVQVELTQRTLQSRQESFQLVQTRFDAGVASELDLNQAKTLLDSASASLAQLVRTQAQADNALVLLIGSPLPVDLPAPATFGREQLLASVPAGLPSDMLERRPDILAAENQLKAANANIGAARAAFFPNISLTGFFGSTSPSLDELFSGGKFWTFSPSIMVPIFAGGSLVEGLSLAKARDNIAVAQYEKAIQQAFREVSDALAGEATFTAQLDAQRALEASSARTLELSNLRYDSGVDSYLQVQTAQVDFFNAQIALVQTGLASLSNRVELYKALGGGWQATHTVKTQ